MTNSITYYYYLFLRTSHFLVNVYSYYLWVLLTVNIPNGESIYYHHEKSWKDWGPQVVALLCFSLFNCFLRTFQDVLICCQLLTVLLLAWLGCWPGVACAHGHWSQSKCSVCTCQASFSLSNLFLIYEGSQS